MIEVGNIYYSGKVVSVYDKNGNEKAKIVMDKTTIHYREIASKNYIELQFEYPEVISFIRGDYMLTGGRIYMLRKKAKPEEVSKIRYKYTLQFEGRDMVFQDIRMYYLTQGLKEVTWTLYASVNEILTIACDNINRYFGNEYWQVGDVSSSFEKYSFSFDNMNVFDALAYIAETVKGEWFAEDGHIHLLSKYEIGNEIEFESEVTVEKLNPDSGEDTTNGHNRFPFFGSTRNIPTNYRETVSGEVVDAVSTKRLRMPAAIGDTLDAVEGLTGIEVSEGDAIINEDIYPKRISTISAVSTVGYTDTDTDTGEVTDWNAYRISDAGLEFIKDYVFSGQELRIVFQSGKLAGLDFAVNFISSANSVSVFEIVRNDDYGKNLPNDTLKPEVGDTFVLYNFNVALVSAQYTADAEQELHEYGLEWIAKNFRDTDVYNTKTVIVKCAEDGYNFEVGQKVKLISDRFDGGYRSSRVMGFEKSLLNPFDCTYHVGDNYTYSRSGSMQSQISENKEQTKKNATIQESTAKSLRRNWKSATETIEMLQNAVEGFTTGINPVTVQTMALLVGNESLQFRFVDSMTSPSAISHAFNYDNATKKLTTDAGIIQHMTLGISSITTNRVASDYKYWAMDAFESSLITDSSIAFYLYAKCSKTEQTGVFVLSQTSIKLEEVEGYYHLLTGILSSEIDASRDFVSLYGFTEVLPGRITTDMIASADGQSYFDLASGIFKAINVDLSGKVEATSGRIGGFNITGSALTNDFDSDSAYIIFRYDPAGIFAGIGTNILPASAGSRGVARFTNEDTTNTYGRNIALYVGSKNAAVNDAIFMSSGWISGFAVNSKQINTSMTLTHEMCQISCYNTADITLTLPSPASAQIGKMYLIRQMNISAVTIAGTLHLDGSVSSVTVGQLGDAVILVNDGQFWTYNKMNR